MFREGMTFRHDGTEYEITDVSEETISFDGTQYPREKVEAIVAPFSFLTEQTQIVWDERYYPVTHLSDESVEVGMKVLSPETFNDWIEDERVLFHFA